MPDSSDEDTQRTESSTENKPAGTAFHLGGFDWGRLVDGITADAINRFKILREIGRGGFGVVYLAEDQGLNRQVAIKIARPEITHDPQGIERFRKEAQAAARLNHPGIIPVFEIGEYQRLHYYVMPFLDGENLMDWMREQTQPISERTAAMIVLEIAKATHFGHEQGIIHRDLKPHNVLMSPAPETKLGFQPVLLDFGLSEVVETLASTASVLIGTPMYMAPEQATHLSRRVTRQSDIYSIGVILFQLLTNRLPLQANTISEAISILPTAPVPSPSDFRSDLSEGIEAICLKCLRKDPARRYATAGELVEDIERHLIGSPVLAGRAGWLERLDFALRFKGWEQRLGLIVIGMNLFNAVWCILVTFLLGAQLSHLPSIAGGFWPMMGFLILVAVPIHSVGAYLGRKMTQQTNQWRWLLTGAVGSLAWDVYLWLITFSAGNESFNALPAFMHLYDGSPMAQLMIFCLIAIGFAGQTLFLGLGAWSASQRHT